MKVSVWDTYVKKHDGSIMHFDILVPDSIKDDFGKVKEFGREYLGSKLGVGDDLSTNECQFCHIEQALDKVIKDIESRGYSIVEMENCN